MKLKDICLIQSGGTPSRTHAEYWNNGTIPWVKISDFSGKRLLQTEERITPKGLDNSSAKVFPRGTLLYTIFATLGKVCILDIDAATNQAIAGLTITSSAVEPDYLYYFLSSLEKYVNNVGRGVAQNNINLTILRELDVPVPELSKQVKISNLLEKIDALIATHKHELYLLDDLVKSRFVELFGDIANSYFKWDSKPLGELCTIVRGGSPRPIEKYLGGNTPWIKIGDATENDNIYLHSTKEHIIQEGIKKSRLIKSGSLIFANCGVSLGFARIVTFDGCIHDGWLAMEDIDSRLDKVFLLLPLNQMTEHFRGIAPVGTQPNLNTGIMKAFNQILPPLNLQRAFVRFVKQMNKSKLAVQQSLEKLETLRKSLMQHYFG